MRAARRASHGESTIYQDSTGRWHGQVSMGLKEHGQRDRRHVSGKRRADVVAKVRELERKRDAGLAVTAGRPPAVGEWMAHWLDGIAAQRVRPTTLRTYRTLVDKYIQPTVGHHRLDRLQPEHVEALYVRMSAGGLAPSTVLQTHRVD
jgi:integrase